MHCGIPSYKNGVYTHNIKYKMREISLFKNINFYKLS